MGRIVSTAEILTPSWRAARTNSAWNVPIDRTASFTAGAPTRLVKPYYLGSMVSSRYDADPALQADLIKIKMEQKGFEP